MTTTTSAVTLAGTFGRYRPIAKLGGGGMADVYLAALGGPAGFTKLVVIKEMKADLAREPEYVAMFLDEARLAARLSHPNIVQTFEVTSEGGRHAMVMEYLDGQPLSRIRSRVNAFGPAGEAVQLRVIADALAGLHHAHDLCDFDGRPLGVVHRDVSPHNVFVTYEGEAKVVDFGIAKTADAIAHTGTGIIKGKLSYMSPEQMTGRSAPPEQLMRAIDPGLGVVDRRADVFAAGIMIWEAAARRRIWQDLEEVAVMYRLTCGEIPRLRDFAPGASPVLDALCARALAHNPADRHGSADELRRDLESYLATCPVRVSSREVGELVRKVFEEERQKLRRIIEEQLRSLRTPAGTVAAAGVLAGLPDIAPSGDLGSRSQSALSAVGPMVTPPHVRAARPRRAGHWIGLAGVGAAVGALAVAWAVTRQGQPAIPTAAATAPATLATSPQKPPTIRLTVTVKPPGAKVTIDGQPMTGRLEAPADRLTPHELKIEAPGHVTQTRTIVYDRDLELDISLERKPVRPVAPLTKPTASTGGGEVDLGY